MRRPLLFGCLPLLILVIGLLVWIGSKAVPLVRYSKHSRSINEEIKALRDRRPATVSPQLWEECVAWASIAHCNICFSEEHASYQAMCRFEEQLDEKLKGNVDLDTIEWIGDRLAETGPHGQRYMTNWREQWKALQRPGKRVEPSQDK